MTTLTPLTVVTPNPVAASQPAPSSQRREAHPGRLHAAMASDAWQGAIFGAKISAALSVPVSLATLVTSGMPGLASSLPGKLLVVAGVTAASAAVFGAAGAVASQAKTQTGAALSAAAVGGAVAGIAAGIATRNVGITAFAIFSGAMITGIAGNGVGETLNRPN